MLATNVGCREAVGPLLLMKANPDHYSSHGCNAVLLAAQGGHADCLKKLIKHKVGTNKHIRMFPTALYFASQNGNASIVKILLEARANPNAAEWVDRATPLFIASQQGHTECVSALLKARAKCNFGNSGADGVSPLFIAVQKKQNHICQQLLGNSSIKVDDPTKDGTTALLMSIQIGNLEGMQLIIKAGADIERADKAGRTPLLTAAEYGDLDAIELLIRHGVDLKKTGPDGRTAQTLLAEEFGDDLLKIAARIKGLPSSDHQHDLSESICSKAAALFAQHGEKKDNKLEEDALREILVTLGCEGKLGTKSFNPLLKQSFTKFAKDALDFQELLRLYTMLMADYKKAKRDAQKQQVAKNEIKLITVKIEQKPGLLSAREYFDKYSDSEKKLLGADKLREIMIAMGEQERQKCLGAKHFETYIEGVNKALQGKTFTYEMFLESVYNGTAEDIKEDALYRIGKLNPHSLLHSGRAPPLPSARELFDKYAYVDCSRRAGKKTLGEKELKQILIVMGKKDGTLPRDVIIRNAFIKSTEWDVAYDFGRFLSIYNWAAEKLKATKNSTFSYLWLPHVPYHVTRVIRTTPAPQISAVAASDSNDLKLPSI